MTFRIVPADECFRVKVGDATARENLNAAANLLPAPIRVPPTGWLNSKVRRHAQSVHCYAVDVHDNRRLERVARRRTTHRFCRSKGKQQTASSGSIREYLA